MQQYLTNKKWLALLCLASLAACKKFVAVDPPATQVQTENIFKSDPSALSAALGLYVRMGQQALAQANGAMTLIPGLTADEFYNTISSGTYDPIVTNAIQPTDVSFMDRCWSSAYRNIYQANAVLEGLRSSTSLTDSLKKQLMGEMLVVRSFTYFYLVNCFGDVPLETTTDYRVNRSLPRTPVAQVYSQIISDLLLAQTLLKPAYPSASRSRPNLWTATALLARVYLYQNDWARAEAQATSVISSGSYALTGTPAVVFAANSTETIWQLVRDNSNTTDGLNFIPSSASIRPNFTLTPFIWSALVSGDSRKTAWTNSITIAGTTYYYPYKYKVRATSPITEYYVLLRLAELYLIRAEARAHQGDIPGAQADLNKTRNRAGLPNTTAADMPSLLLAIEKERQVELMFEWGHRWFDLKRTGRIDAVLGVEKAGTWQSTAALYPIGQNQINSNPALVQNPGY